MWFNILPGFFIIFAGVALPGYGLYYAHYWICGNHYRRSLLDRWSRIVYQRDTRLTGDAYIVNGLEFIPDEEDPCKP